MMCQRKITMDPVYFSMYVPGLIVYDSLAHVTQNQTNVSLCNLSSKHNS